MPVVEHRYPLVYCVPSGKHYGTCQPTLLYPLANQYEKKLKKTVDRQHHCYASEHVTKTDMVIKNASGDKHCHSYVTKQTYILQQLIWSP